MSGQSGEALQPWREEREEQSNEIVTRTLLIIWEIMNYFYETMPN